jgi:hypothetical protein
MPILRLPDLRLRLPYTVLPLPNAVDTWLRDSGVDMWKKAVHLGDLLSDQVICTVQLYTSEVSFLLSIC